ncbi:MAG TPA: hypothetical protein VGO03_10355 [Acidimicrobiia bacterium]|jgi:hypothetical protein
MSKPVALEEFRYVGDKRTQIVYDMDEMASNDRVAQAVADLVVTQDFACFGPDTLAEARNRGYRPYRDGISGSARPVPRARL